VGQLDDTSAGSTEIDMPGLAIRTPISSESIFTPFSAFAFVRYNDPGALAAAANNAPANGPTPVVPALLSNAPVAFSFAPLGSASFTALGNANQPGGALIPALAKGAYVDRFTLTDSRGDVNAFESSFVAQENAPTGPAATKCSAKSSGGLKASIAAGKSKGKSKGKKKRKPKSSQITVTLSCSAAAAGGHVAVWLQRGSSLVANGRGAVTRRVARITMKGKFPRGTYRVTEVLEAGGQATESTEILTLR
jgi:hypothetical protein